MSWKKFCNDVTRSLFYGTLPSWQEVPLLRLYEEAERRGETQIERIAYVMATAYHETDRFKVFEEYGRGQGRSYGEPVLLIRGSYAKYHGRGMPQNTWLRNYGIMTAAASAAFGKEIDLVNNPDRLISDRKLDAFCMWEGMLRGLYTGKNLADYIRPGSVDYRNARRVINGTDRAKKIERHALSFEAALRLI